MTPEERENAQIIYGLSLQPPAPKNVKSEPHFSSHMNMVTCPECETRIREVGYAGHWSKAHRQRHQIDYFKRWKNEHIASKTFSTTQSKNAPLKPLNNTREE